MLTAKKLHTLYSASLFKSEKAILSIWIIVAAFLGISKALLSGVHNNYLIYKHVYINSIHETPLFIQQPSLFGDVNHYGPFFGILIAPFAMLPDIVGSTLWIVSMSVVLFYAIRSLNLEKWQEIAILWIVTNSLIVSQVNMQFNILSAALIILSFSYIRKEKDIWAALMIAIGTFVKLYGIAGLAFLFFSKSPKKLILWILIWSGVLFVLPMLYSSPDFVISQYVAWWIELVHKNAQNSHTMFQDVSFLGMMRKSTGHYEWSNLPMLVGALAIFALPYLRFSQFSNPKFQLNILASVLIFIVLFSTGSEPNTYLLAISGVAIWFVTQSRPFSKWVIAIFTFSILLASFGPSDLFPRTIYKQYVLPYALQALPCTLVWLTISYQLIFQSNEEKMQ